MPEAISAPIFSTPCSRYFETQGRELTPDLYARGESKQTGGLLPRRQPVMRRSDIVVIIVLITTKQSSRNNRLSSLEGFSFHEKIGS